MIRSPGESMTEILLPSRLSNVNSYHSLTIWAFSWQNQQSDCAPSEDSDQPGHPPSLIRVFAVPDQPGHPPLRTAKTLIRLGGCLGWSESSLGAQSLCWCCYIGRVVRPQLAETLLSMNNKLIAYYLKYETLFISCWCMCGGANCNKLQLHGASCNINKFINFVESVRPKMTIPYTD